ncbi:MAG: site-2 protease family protein [Coriobacteriales bacterium]|jgi:Zn-dependent protease|nr:site-2 protease family protein [Coriobacteriales bacterium]
MEDFGLFIVRILCFAPAIVIHEVSHGFVAHLLGDPTAKSQGRLSLNPLKHIDPFGTVILPLMLALGGGPVFGYAKPVPYNPSYFKNIKVGEVLTGLAGPASNLLMGLLGALIALLVGGVGPASGAPELVKDFLVNFVFINFCLMFFNLLPIPPLDGSSVIFPFIPRKYIPRWYQIQRYALPIFFVVVFLLPYAASLLGLYIDPIGWYLRATAINLTNLVFPI